MIRRSTKAQVKSVNKLVSATKERVERLLNNGKKVHIIWDFDGVLADFRSEDVFALSGYDLDVFFAHEHRLLFQPPNPGPWHLPFIQLTGTSSIFPKNRFTFDIVTARSSFISMRVQVFCLTWGFYPRWMTMVGHQPKSGSYRIILESFKNDPDVHIFCVDDSKKHIDAFNEVAKKMGMEDRTCGILSPVVRSWTKKELREYLKRVMSAQGEITRVRDPSGNTNKFTVLPGGLGQFHKVLANLVSEKKIEAEYRELRNAFVKHFGEPGKKGCPFKNEKELKMAIKEFVVGIHTS